MTYGQSNTKKDQVKNFAVNMCYLPGYFCLCKRWRINIGKLNIIFTRYVLMGKTGYTGDKITNCPWCGKKLIKWTGEGKIKFDQHKLSEK